MSKEKAIDKITQAIFLIKPYFEGNLEALEDRMRDMGIEADYVVEQSKWQ